MKSNHVVANERRRSHENDNDNDNDNEKEKNDWRFESTK